MNEICATFHSIYIMIILSQLFSVGSIYSSNESNFLSIIFVTGTGTGILYFTPRTGTGILYFTPGTGTGILYFTPGTGTGILYFTLENQCST
jgi:hypothetical protein